MRPKSPLAHINRISRKIEETTLFVAIGLLSLSLIINVIARQLGMSIYYTDELAMFLVIIITFIGLSNAARNGRHIRMAALIDVSPTKVQKWMIIVSSAISAIVTFYLSYLSLNYVYQSYKWGQVTPALRMPYWILIAIAPIGFFLTGIQYVLAIKKNFDEESVWISAEQQSEYE